MRPATGMLPARAIAFVVVFLILQLGWQALHGTRTEWVAVHFAVVAPATQLVNLLTPAVHAQAADFTIAAPEGSLRIETGCEGFEALFLLCAAFSVAPIPTPIRLRGILWGTLVVFAVNQARLLGLFYAYRASPALFSALHGVVAPVVVVQLVLTYFYVYLVHSQRRWMAGAV